MSEHMNYNMCIAEIKHTGQEAQSAIPVEIIVIMIIIIILLLGYYN